MRTIQRSFESGLHVKEVGEQSNRAGSGSFGTQQQRKIAIEIMGESTPGPGAYNGDARMRSSSRVARRDGSGEKRPRRHSIQNRRSAKIAELARAGRGRVHAQLDRMREKRRQPGQELARGARFSGADGWERARWNPGQVRTRSRY